jgi:hypothetical protein
MTTTTSTARRLLRDNNPVSQDAFSNATRDHLGQETFDAILAGQAGHSPSPGHASARPGSKGPRSQVLSRHRRPIAVSLVAAATAVALAVAVSGTGGPAGRVKASGAKLPTTGKLGSLVASLTYHPSANPADAAAVLRRLADAAAVQPSPALGPVEYSKSVGWGLDLGPLHYGLNYRSHEFSTQENWLGKDGASLSVSTYPGGKIPPGIIPISRSDPSKWGEELWAWYNPATLPTGEAALRQHLLHRPLPCFGAARCVTAGGHPDDAWTIMSNALDLMGSEPLPPAVRASLLRLMADQAAARVPDAKFFDLGTVTDRVGHTGVAIGYQTPAGTPAPLSLWVYIFDPGTGTLLGKEYAFCNGKFGAYPASGSCSPSSYDQIVQITAVPAIPASPPPSNPSASPGVPAANSPTP